MDFIEIFITPAINDNNAVADKHRGDMDKIGEQASRKEWTFSKILG
jgi:hypothetical protein